jgi:hypothetical protein
MARHHMINGEKVMFTAEEETARDAEEAKWEAGKPARAFSFLRNQRNILLKETDFYSLSDVTMSDEMKAYRQALRDLPATLDNSSVLSFDMESGFPAKP